MFLDLQVFDQMHKLAKAESAELRGVIKHLNSHDSEKKLKRARAELSEIIEDIATQRDLCDKHRDRLEVLLLEQQSINDQVQAASQKPIDIVEIQSQRSRAIAALSKTQKQLEGYEAEYDAKMSQIGDLEFLLPQIDEQARHAQEEMNTYNLIVSQISVVEPEVKK